MEPRGYKNLNVSRMNYELKTLRENLPMKTSLVRDRFTAEFYQTFRLTPMFLKLSHK
jgi:hypothetical protein